MHPNHMLLRQPMLLYQNTQQVPKYLPTQTLQIVEHSLHVKSCQLDVLELMLEMPPSYQTPVLFPSNKMWMLVTLRPFVSNAKMLLEVQFNMTIGKSNK